MYPTAIWDRIVKYRRSLFHLGGGPRPLILATSSFGRNFAQIQSGAWAGEEPWAKHTEFAPRAPQTPLLGTSDLPQHRRNPNSINFWFWSPTSSGRAPPQLGKTEFSGKKNFRKSRIFFKIIFYLQKASVKSFVWSRRVPEKFLAKKFGSEIST